jgi:hypothetical protein
MFVIAMLDSHLHTPIVCRAFNGGSADPANSKAPVGGRRAWRASRLPAGQVRAREDKGEIKDLDT